jgi:hypothetical protein
MASKGDVGAPGRAPASLESSGMSIQAVVAWTRFSLAAGRCNLFRRSVRAGGLIEAGQGGRTGAATGRPTRAICVSASQSTSAPVGTELVGTQGGGLR